MPDLDDSFRRLAHQSLDDSAAAVDVDADLTALREHVAGASEPERARPDGRERGRWLAAAAAAFLVVGGIVAISWARTRGGPASDAGPNSTVVMRADASAPVTVRPADPATPAPTTAGDPSTTTVISDISSDPCMAGVAPPTLPDGTAPGATQRAGGMAWEGVIQIPVPAEDWAEFDEEVEHGGSKATAASWEAVVRSYDQNQLTNVILRDVGDPNGCLRWYGVDLDELAAQELAAEWLAALSGAPVGHFLPCWEVPASPPSLVDGSPPGEAVLTDRLATWGGDSLDAVRQLLDDQPFGDFEAVAATQRTQTSGVARVVPLEIGDGAIGEIAILTQRAPGYCIRWYSIGPGVEASVASALAQRWAISLDTATPPGDPRPDLDVPIYGARHAGSDQLLEVVRFEGAPMAETIVTDLAATAATERDRLPTGATVALDLSDADWTRCANHTALADGQVLHPDLPAARTLAVTPSGTVFATRDVCPEGTSWGDPQTHWELVRIDFNAPDPRAEVVLRQTNVVPPEFTGVNNEFFLTAVSPDGRFVAFRESYAPEHSRYRIVDMIDPSAPLDLPTTCDRGRHIVGRPSFVAADFVVVARQCWNPEDDARPEFGYDATGNGEIRIELLQWTTGIVSEVGPLPDNEMTAYSATLGLDAEIAPDGAVRVVVSGTADVESPTRAFLLDGNGGSVEVTQPGVTGWAFDPADLIP